MPDFFSDTIHPPRQIFQIPESEPNHVIVQLQVDGARPPMSSHGNLTPVTGAVRNVDTLTYLNMCVEDKPSLSGTVETRAGTGTLSVDGLRIMHHCGYAVRGGKWIGECMMRVRRLTDSGLVRQGDALQRVDATPPSHEYALTSSSSLQSLSWHPSSFLQNYNPTLTLNSPPSCLRNSGLAICSINPITATGTFPLPVFTTCLVD
jgi:hypothetical protein